MGQRAKINSIPSLQHMSTALCKFGDLAGLLLDESHADIRRTLLWLREDRRRFWKTQCWQRREQYVQAKIALSSRQSLERGLAGSPSSCVDEKKQLARAQRRVEEAELKYKRTNAWIQTLEKKQADFRALTKGLVGMLSTELPNARAGLGRMIDSLEAYFSLAPPETDPTPAAADHSGPMTLPPVTQPLKSTTTEADETSEADSPGEAGGSTS